ncbi:hypothetical protein FE392_18425 [Xenorhabdus sp. 12]|uniref:Putative adhesin Stv domain-containing protein n=1 Tax=Xenorhabdus santafensis TaxID=2582833 RepID=A0ABU4SEM3_9GAMM|nr:hypothetical protein [Xenorhabdus sp. 12]MDX7989256.1 hypothetical protein [Xenorhabdus sp. 12]
MKILTYKNLVIKNNKNPVEKAIILAHGGFTPVSCCGFLQGSGFTDIPEGITLAFNCLHDNVSLGGQMARAILRTNEQNTYPIAEKVTGPRRINNYSLSFSNDFETNTPTKEVDIITVAPHGKVHLSDIFTGIRMLNLNYNYIYFAACRIDSSRSISISRVTNP